MELSPKTRKIYTHVVPLNIRKIIEKIISGPYPKIYDQKKFLFIHIPKTAGKSIDAIIGVKGACHLTYLEYEAAVKGKINDYYIFTIVRDPADRFVSAYNYLSKGGNQSKESIDFCTRWIKPGKNINDFVINSLTRPEVFNGNLMFKPQYQFLMGINKNISDRINIFYFNDLENELAKIPSHIKIGELTHINKSQSPENQKISTQALALLHKIYADDYRLFDFQTGRPGVPGSE